MINKKGLWFLTLFSLILVLSVYYITMPEELFLGANSSYVSNIKEDTENLEKENDDSQEDEENKETVLIEESDILKALRVEADCKLAESMEMLKTILASNEANPEEKNEAYEKMKDLNITHGEEESIEKEIEKVYKAKSFVKIDGDQIRVVIAKDTHDAKLANDIMRTVQSKYNKKMYISVKFQK